MRKQLSQQKLLEILIHEIDMLRDTSKNINAIAPEIEKQLHSLKTSKLKFDLNTERLEWLLAIHEKEVERKCSNSKVVFLDSGWDFCCFSS